MTPNKRTLDYLRKRGWTCAITETWVPKINVRRDLFHCIDVLGLRENECLGVQATTASNVAARKKKSAGLPELRAWLEAGNDFEVWGWKKPDGDKKGDKRAVWTVVRWQAGISNGSVAFTRVEQG